MVTCRVASTRWVATSQAVIVVAVGSIASQTTSRPSVLTSGGIRCGALTTGTRTVPSTSHHCETPSNRPVPTSVVLPPVTMWRSWVGIAAPEVCSTPSCQYGTRGAAPRGRPSSERTLVPVGWCTFAGPGWTG